MISRFMTDTVSHEARTGSTPKGTPQYSAALPVKCCKRTGGDLVTDQSTGEQFVPALTVWTTAGQVERGDRLDGYTVRAKDSSTPLRGSKEFTYYAS